MTSVTVKPPSNMQNVEWVTSDVFNIAERVKQIDERLRIALLPNQDRPWAVFEVGPDGVERLVKKYERLDASVLEDLRYMLAVPFEQRLELVTREIDRANESHGGFSGEKFERFAFEFDKAARKSGISDPVWSRSYRNIGGKK